MTEAEVVQRVHAIGLSVAEEASVRLSRVSGMILELLDEELPREQRVRLAHEARQELLRVQDLLERLRELEERERICNTLCAPRWPPSAAIVAFGEV